MANKQKYATVGGLTFSGETVALAKERGEREVSRFTREAGFGPSVFRVGKLTVLVWPCLEGWSYQADLTLSPDGDVRASCFMGGTREMAIVSAIGDAAQRQWTHEVANDEAYFVDAFACARRFADVSKRIADEIGHAGWQRRYKAAFEVSGDRNWSHDVASRTASISEAATLARREAA